MKRLLHMEYTPTELAKEIGCTRGAIDRAIAAGCPTWRNGKVVYIVGNVFAKWYRELPKKLKIKLKPNEVYCLRCKKARKFTIDSVRHNSPGVELVQGKCSVCGAIVNRLRKEKTQC